MRLSDLRSAAVGRNRMDTAARLAQTMLRRVPPLPAVSSDTSNSVSNRSSALRLSDGAATLGLSDSPEPETESLVTEPSLSDRKAWFVQQVQPHYAQLAAFVRGTYPSVRDIDDVVQESYLRLWKAAASAPIESARAFLFLVARRVALNFIRKERNAPFHPHGSGIASRVVDERPDACEAAMFQERIDLLADALMSLPARCRDVTVLHKIKGFTQKEVAQQLGISERTVETHVRAGVARCHAYLRDHGVRPFNDNET